MKKIYVIPVALFIVVSCLPPQSGQETPIVETTTQGLLDQYLAEDINLSDVPPADGYHSPEEALYYTAEELIGDPMFYVDSGGSRGSQGSWLTECRIQTPILVHDFRRNDEHACDFYYYLYATHPDYGVIGSVTYHYNANSEVNWGIGEICEPRINEGDYAFVDQAAAEAALENEVGGNYSEPVAVYMSTDYNMARQNFFWYAEVPDSRGTGHEEYVIDNIVRKDQVFGEDSRSIGQGARVYRLTEQINLLDVIEKTKEGIHSRSLSGIPDVPVLSSSAFERVN